jgi:signal transduction histidine kinase
MARDTSYDRKFRQLRALMDMAALVNSTLDIREIKKRAVDAAARLLNSETGSLLLIDPETGELFFEVALEMGEKLKEVRLKKGQGIAGWVAEHGTPQIIHDVKSDKRFFVQADQTSGFSTRNMVCAPVRTNEKMLGVLEAVNKKDGKFDSDDIDLLVAFSHHVAIAMEKALLYEENIRHLETRLREEKRHARERERILKDLHDGIGGITTNISLLADMAQSASSFEEVRSTLSTISELSREGLSEIRSFMNSIDDSRMDWHTLIADIRHYGSTFIEPHGISFQVTSAIGDIREQPVSILYLNLFRICKEAFANIVKHSGAKTVTVSVDVRPEKLLLSVKDDGTGLDERKKAGRGLRNMKTRAEEIGGKVTVASDRGTRVSLELPLPLRFGRSS